MTYNHHLLHSETLTLNIRIFHNNTPCPVQYTGSSQALKTIMSMAVQCQEVHSFMARCAAVLSFHCPQPHCCRIGLKPAYLWTQLRNQQLLWDPTATERWPVWLQALERFHYTCTLTLTPHPILGSHNYVPAVISVRTRKVPLCHKIATLAS